MLLLEACHVLAHQLAHPSRSLDQAILLVDIDDRQCRGAAHGMAVVGQAATEGLVGEGIRDALPHRHRSQRQVGGGQALGHGEDVRDDAPMVDGEPLAGATEAAHHLVGDHHDAVAVADLAHTLEIAVRRDEDAVGAHHRLEDEAGDGVAALVHDHVFQLTQRHVHRLGLRATPLVRVGGTVDARYARLAGPAARVSGGHHHLAGGTVIGAVASQDLVPAGVLARQLDGVLVGLGPAVGEEHHVQVAGRELRQLATQSRARLVGHERIGIGQLLRLRRDGVDDALVTVADVDRHQLAVPVEVPLAVGGVEVAALGRLDRDRVGRVLGHPLEHRVLLRERHDLISAHDRPGLLDHVLTFRWVARGSPLV